MAGAAGAAIGAPAVAAALPAISVADDAEIFALIAEEERLYSIGASYDRQLHEWLEAQPDEERFLWYRNLKDLPEPAASFYRNSIPWFEAADRVMGRIERAVPKTVEGTIALLKLANPDPLPTVQNVIAALPRLVARGGAA